MTDKKSIYFQTSLLWYFLLLFYLKDGGDLNVSQFLLAHNFLQVMVGFPALRKEYFVLTRWMEIEEKLLFCCHRSALDTVTTLLYIMLAVSHTKCVGTLLFSFLGYCCVFFFLMRGVGIGLRSPLPCPGLINGFGSDQGFFGGEGRHSRRG